MIERAKRGWSHDAGALIVLGFLGAVVAASGCWGARARGLSGQELPSLLTKPADSAYPDPDRLETVVLSPDEWKEITGREQGVLCKREGGKAVADVELLEAIKSGLRGGFWCPASPST